MNEPRVSLSEARLSEILELRFAQFERTIADHFITEKRAREIVRDEAGLASRDQWDVRSKIAAVGVFLLSVSTFIFTIFHGGDAPPPVP